MGESVSLVSSCRRHTPAHLRTFPPASSSLLLLPRSSQRCTPLSTRSIGSTSSCRKRTRGRIRRCDCWRPCLRGREGSYPSESVTYIESVASAPRRFPSLPSPSLSPIALPLSHRPPSLPSPSLSPIALPLSHRPPSLPSPPSFPSPSLFPIHLPLLSAFSSLTHDLLTRLSLDRDTASDVLKAIAQPGLRKVRPDLLIGLARSAIRIAPSVTFAPLAVDASEYIATRSVEVLYEISQSAPVCFHWHRC